MIGQGETGSAHGRRGVLVNFVSLSASAWSQQLLNFITVIYLARALGVDGLGQIMLAQSVVLYFRLGSDMGLDLLGNRRIARNPGRAASVVGEFTGSRLINAALAWVVLLLVAAILHLVRPVGWLVVAFGFLLAPFALSLEWAFSGLERMEVVGAFRFLAAAAWFALVFFLVRTPDAILVVPLANVAAMSAAALLLFAWFRRQYGPVVPVFRFDRWASLVRDAAPTGVSLLLIQIYVGFGLIAIGLIEGEESAGFFGAAQKLVLFVTALSAMFGAALYPRLSALHQQGREPFERAMSAGFRAMLLAGAPLGVGGALVAPLLIPAVYGPGYEASVPVFRWLVPSVILSFANIPFGFALLAAGRQRAYFRAAVAGAVVNVVATLALIPALHLRGPVVATLLTESVVLVILFVESRQVGRLAAGWEVVSVALSTAVMAAAILLLHPASLPAQLLLGAAVYAATLFASRGVSRADLASLRDWGQSARG